MVEDAVRLSNGNLALLDSCLPELKREAHLLDELERGIREHFAKLQQLLKKKEEFLLTQVHREIDLEALQHTHSDLRDAVTFASRILEEGTDTDVSTMKSTIVRRLNDLNSEGDWDGFLKASEERKAVPQMEVTRTSEEIEYFVDNLIDLKPGAP